MWAQRTYSTLSMYLAERIVESKWEKIIHKSFVCLRWAKLLQFSPGIKCKTFVEYRRLHLQLIPLGGSPVPQTNLCTRNKAIPSALKEQKPIIYINGNLLICIFTQQNLFLLQHFDLFSILQSIQHLNYYDYRRFIKYGRMI